MLDGKTFLPETGTPIRKIACMMRPFAEADPVPLAVAILNANSLTRSIVLDGGELDDVTGCERNGDERLPHVPCIGRAALGAQPAVQAHVFVFHHHSPSLLEATRDKECLRGIVSGSIQPNPQVR